MDERGENFKCRNVSTKEVEYERKMSNQAMRVLYELMENCQLCDAAIVLDDDSTLHVHRAILSVCSLYFRTIFTTTMEKDDRKSIRLHGVSKAIMTEILSYIYLRKISITRENVGQLLITADFLQIDGVVKLCCDFMRTMLKPKTCVGIMTFAQMYHCTNLFKKAQAYFVRHFVNVVSNSEEFLELDFEDLITILKKDDLNVKSEEIAWESILKWINFDVPNREKHIAALLGTIRLGLLHSQFFKDHVKDHPFVLSSKQCEPLVLQALNFLSERDKMPFRREVMPTPAIAQPRIPNEILFVIGGWSGGAPTNYIETYDSRADNWIKIFETDPSGARAYHGTAVLGFSIYIIGGFDGNEYFNSCRCFNTVTKEWREIAPMNARRCYVSVTMLDDMIYAIGGYDGRFRRNSVERYDYRTNQWLFVEPMHVPRSDANACVLESKIYVTGGFNGFECLYSVEVYDPDMNQWTIIKDMRSRRSGVSCIAFRGYVYVIGGFNGITRLSTGEKYDPETNKWYQIAEMFIPRSNFAVEVIDDMLFAIGGFNGVSTIYNVESYDSDLNEWSQVSNMTIYRSALSACIVAGLPNVEDYTHKHRDNIMEEKRQKMMAMHPRRYMSVPPMPRPHLHSIDFYNGLIQPYLFRMHSRETLDIIHQLSVEYQDYLRRINRTPALQHNHNANNDANIYHNNGDYNADH